MFLVLSLSLDITDWKTWSSVVIRLHRSSLSLELTSNSTAGERKFLSFLVGGGRSRRHTQGNMELQEKS